MKAMIQPERKAKSYAYRLLKYRNRSEKEIRDKFLKRKFSAEVIENVINELKECGYVDDLRFAQEWLNFRLKVSFGLKRIIFELRRKGISEAIIKRLVKSEGVTSAESGALADIAARRLALVRKCESDKIKIRQKMYGFLLRRGFSSADIIDCLQNLILF